MALPFIVTPKALADARQSQDIQIVAVTDTQTFKRAHIFGARSIPPAAFIRHAPPRMGLLPDAVALSHAFSRIGLDPNLPVVVYDHGQLKPAARLVYTLEAASFKDVHLLDGGLPAWQSAGLEVATGPAQDFPHTQLDLQLDDNRIASRDWILLHQGELEIIDVRTPNEYNGTENKARLAGHIPGAINIDWQACFNDQGQLKDEQTLAEIVKDLDQDQQQVTYCQSHMRSSAFYCVLRHLGFENVLGYPGAWSDWGNKPDSPVEK